MMKIAVIGSRKFKNVEFFNSIMDRLVAAYGEFIVVSGLAEGADAMAMAWSHRNGWWKDKTRMYPADWSDLSHPDAVIKVDKWGNEYDAKAGFRRNHKIINDADMVVAFMDQKNPTPGTSHSIRLAKEKGIPVYIFWKE